MEKSFIFLLSFLLFQLNVFAQDENISVTGTITDVTGMPIPGVNVIQRGTTNGVVTNFDGEYIIDVPPQATLDFSFVGYSPISMEVDGRSQIDVVMESDVAALDEVVVVGYGTQRKATLTGAVTSVESEKIVKSPAISVSNSLSGLLPGLTTMNATGKPGENLSSVLIRGTSTTGDNSPLVVVDGVPDETGAWQRINQNNVESISVLKDASAAIYGARAANGVILITTKRGTVSKPTLSYTYNQGITSPTRIPEMVNSWEWATYANEYRVNFQDLTAMYSEEEIQIMREGSDLVRYPNTKWPNEIFKDYALQSMQHLSVRGGTESVRYSVGGSYSNENSMVKNGLHEYKGYNLRSNFDAEITDNLSIGLDWNGGIDDMIEPVIDILGYNISPLLHTFFPNGLPEVTPSDDNTNPALNLTGVGGDIKNITKRNRIKPSFEYDIPRIEGLGITGFYSYTNEITDYKRWREPFTVYSYDAENDEYLPIQGGVVSSPDLRQEFHSFEEKMAHLRVTYEAEMGDHDISGFLGAEQAETTFKMFSAYRRDFLSGAIEELFAGSGNNQDTDGTRAETARRNLIGRFSWGYKEKYLVDFNARYDGSYAFPEDKRWGFFPGISVAWRLSQEDFLMDVDALTELKLRGSYGEMGNDRIAPFQYRELSVLNPIGTFFGGGVQGIITPGVSPNPNITWEVATMTNIGLDASFFENRLGFSVDVFKQRRENILTARTTVVPNYTGLVLPHENVGIIENEGLELMLSYRSRAGNDFFYSISGNTAFVRNEIIEISEPQDMLPYQKKEGHVIGAPLVYNAIGIFRTEEEVESNPILPGTQVGDLRYEDFNGDGTISAADRERIDKGSVPEITFGLNTSFGYKNLSLYANFAGQARAWTYIYERGNPIFNVKREVYENRYTPGSMDSFYPILPNESQVGKGDVSGQPSDFWLQDASFLRLQTLELRYTVPENLVSSLGLAALDFYASGSNIFTITDLKWYDPAGAPTSSAVTEGDAIRYTQGGFYPQTKIYNLGVNITF